MRIACPACDATYEVPDALIGAGRRLRCAKCAHEWLVQPEAPAPAAGLPPPATPLPADTVPPPMIEPRRAVPAMAPSEAVAGWAGGRGAALALWAAWIASGLLLVGAGAGAWIYRGPIMEAWPPAARAYLLFGLA